MTVTPIPGVTYTCDPDNSQWIAPSRPSLPFVPVSTPPPPPPPPGGTIYAGAAPIGTTSYPVPAGAYFVAKNGLDTNAGRAATPFLTIQHAINSPSVPSGSTIVVRGGVYHEKLTTPSTKALTIQAYPLEAVYLDGSQVHSSWTGSGPWTTAYSPVLSRFDVTGYTGTDPFRNYPDQVWVDGVLLQQIADNTTPAAGQFSVNQTAHTLTIGTNPAGHTVAVSDFDICLIGSGGVKFYGIGIRRYSPQAVTYPNAMIFLGGTSAQSVFENCVFEGSSMACLSLTRPDNIVNQCTFQDCGYSGLFGTVCDGLQVTNNIFRRLNRGSWTTQPATGGIKITRTGSSSVNQFRITNNWFTDIPGANAIWFDVSDIQFVINNNYIDGSGATPMQSGISVEESDGGKIGGIQTASYVVGNKVSGCSSYGIRVLCTGWTRFWNNDISNNNVCISGQQDRPQNSGTQVAAGNRTNAECPWHLIHNEYVNNIWKPSTTGAYKIQLASYDNGPKVDTGWDEIDLLDGNWFAPNPTGGSVFQMGRIGGARTTYNTLAALAASDSTVGGPPGAKLGTNYQGTTTPDPVTYGVPLTDAVAAALYLNTGDQVIGPNTAKLPVPLN